METLLSTRRMYRGKILDLDVDEVSLGTGERRSVREVIRKAPCVAVLAVREGVPLQVVLVQQFRYAISQEIVEVPAGIVDPGETPEAAARRELQEETGYTAAKWRSMGQYYPSPGFTDEVVHLFLATDLTEGAARAEDAHITVLLRPAHDLVDQILAGAVPDGKTQAAVFQGMLRGAI